MGIRRFLCSCCTTKNRKTDPAFAVPTEGSKAADSETPEATKLDIVSDAPASVAKPAVGEVSDAEFMKQVLEVSDQLVERKIMTQLLTQLTEGPPSSEFVTALAGAMREVYVTPLFLRLRDTVAKGANDETRREAEECSTLIANAVIEATLKKTPFYNKSSTTKASITELDKETSTAEQTTTSEKVNETQSSAVKGNLPAVVENTVEKAAVAAKETRMTPTAEDEADWTDEEAPQAGEVPQVEEAPVSPRRSMNVQAPETAAPSSESADESDSDTSSSSSSNEEDVPVDAVAVQSAVDSVITSLGGQVKI